MFTNDCSVFRNHFPFSGRQSIDVRNTIIAVNLRSAIFGADGHSICDTAGIGVSVSCGVCPQQNAVGVQQRMHFLNFIRPQQMTFHADLIENAFDIMKPIDLVLIDGQPHRTTTVPTRGLSGFGFQFFV